MDQTIGSLAGVALGFVLSQFATLVRDIVAKRHKRRSGRKLISMELGQNVDLFKHYWRDVSLPPDEDEATENATDRLVMRTREVPYPPASAEVWRNYLGKLPELLDDREFDGVWRHYEIGRELVTLHARLTTDIVGEKRSGHGATRASRTLHSAGIVSARFVDERAALMAEYRTLVETLIRLGNPLLVEV